ncbi:MAG: hypothetical protein ABIN36_14465 [Ferruginibacter sp.]
MVRSIFYFIFCIGMSNNLIAQKVHSEKKLSSDSSGPKPAIRQKAAATQGEKSKHKNVSLPSFDNPKPMGNQSLSAASDNAAKVSEIMKLDYPNMPAHVQSKINANKLQGRNLLEGIVKIFTVEIKECKTDAQHKNTMLFLKPKKGFISSQFVSEGLVKIFVEPGFDSSDLKDAMNSKNIHFNFLNRSYALKN